MVSVRSATIEDIPAILSIYNDAVRHTTAIWIDEEADFDNRRDWFMERRVAGFPVLVATDGDEILGYATYGPFRPHEGYRHTVENSVYVRADRRGRGIGAMLLASLIEAARSEGRHVIVAAIEAGNEVSLILHARFGFRETARMPEVGRKFGRWLDLVMMQLIIED